MKHLKQGRWKTCPSTDSLSIKNTLSPHASQISLPIVPFLTAGLNFDFLPFFTLFADSAAGSGVFSLDELFFSSGTFFCTGVDAFTTIGEGGFTGEILWVGVVFCSTDGLLGTAFLIGGIDGEL